MIELHNVNFYYGNEIVVGDLTLRVDSGELLAVVGPSGCGKSTLLRLIAGLERPHSGTIVGPETSSGMTRFLFQDYDAFPWFTVWDNVKFAVKQGTPPDENKIRETLMSVGLLDSVSKYPAQLSGGMRKRLALARCLIGNPSLLLLDEPFSRLDIDARYEMYELLQKVHKVSKQTIILVTHDIQEAVLLATRVLVSTPRPFSVKSEVRIPIVQPRNDNMIMTQPFIDAFNDVRGALKRK